MTLLFNSRFHKADVLVANLLNLLLFSFTVKCIRNCYEKKYILRTLETRNYSTYCFHENQFGITEDFLQDDL